MNDPPTGFEPLSASAAARPRPGELRTGRPPHGNAALAALHGSARGLGTYGPGAERIGQSRGQGGGQRCRISSEGHNALRFRGYGLLAKMSSTERHGSLVFRKV